MNLKSHNKNKQGFTLLEVLISIVILAFISLGIYEITADTFKLREILSNDADFYNAIRLSMNMVDRDVALLYTPKTMLPPSTLKKIDSAVSQVGTPDTAAADAKDQEAIAVGDREKGTEYWGSVLDKTGIRLTRFFGNETSMKFVTASHVRIYRDARESIYSKVSYGVERVQNDDPLYRDTLTLIKTSNTNVYDMEKDDGPALRRYSILSGIKSFKFQYYWKDKDKWVNTWDSESADTKYLYPSQIRIELEVIGPAPLDFIGTYDFKPEIPINGIESTT